MFSFDDGIGAATMLGLAIGGVTGLDDLSLRPPAATAALAPVEARRMVPDPPDDLSRVRLADGAGLLPLFAPAGVLSLVAARVEQAIR